MSSFRNRDYGSQLLDFKGIEFGKCKATDIDMSLDWQGRTFIFTEVKYHHAPLTLGQKYHLENLVKAVRAGGKVAYAIVSTHETPLGEDIVAANTIVKKIYDGKGWQVAGEGVKLSTQLDELYKEHKRCR